MSRLSRLPRVLLLLYAAFLAVALLSPGSEQQSDAVDWLSRQLIDRGFAAATFDRLEVVMNAVIVVPLTFLGSVVLPRLSWRDWTAFAFLAALAVEAVQALVLPDRQAAFSDVVANTTGALVGAVAYQCLASTLRGRTSR